MEGRKSQIATSISQSKRLLAAGLDPGSADMSWHKYKTSKWDLWVGWSDRELPDLQVVPAWSLSRLWDAFGLDILGGWFSVGSSTSEDVIEELVRMMERRVSSSK